MTPTLRLALASVRRRRRAQVVALVLVCALAAAAVVAGLGAQTSAADQVDAAYERAGHPDLVLFGDEASLRSAATDDAVEAASPPLALADLTTDVDGSEVEVLAIEVDPEALPEVGAPDLVEGRWPAEGHDDEVVVEHSLVTTGIATVGETLTVDSPDGPRHLEVVGAAVELSDCFWPTCDPLRILGRDNTVAALTGDDGTTRSLAAYRLADPASANEVAGRLLGEPGSGLVGVNAWPGTREDILVVGNVFSTMVGGFGLFLLIAAAFVVAGATAARLVARQRALGLLQAMGFSPRQLFTAVWLEHLALAAVGVVIGWLLATPLAPAFQAGLDEVLPGGTSGPALRDLLVAAVLVGLVLTLSVAVPAWRSTHRSVAATIRDVPAAPGGGRAVAGLARRLGAGPSTVCGLRRAFSRPLRAALSAGALAVAAMAVMVAGGFLATFRDVVDDPAVTGNPWDVTIDAPAAAEADVEAALSSTPGVEAWFTEREVTGTVGSQGFTVRIMGGEPEAAAYVVQEGAPLRAAGEAMVGYAFLDDTGLEVGDTVDLEVEDEVLGLEIVGWYSDTADAGAMVQIREEAVGEAAPEGGIDWRVVAEAGTSREDLAASLQEALGDGAAVDPLEVEGVAPAEAAIAAMVVVLGLVALANLFVTSLAAARERARALGVLRTIGSRTSQLLTQAAVGAGAVGALAALAGVPLGWVAYRALSDALTAGIGIGPGFGSDPPVVLVVITVPAVALLAAVAGALASLGLVRRPAAELVRYE